VQKILECVLDIQDVECLSTTFGLGACQSACCQHKERTTRRRPIWLWILWWAVLGSNQFQQDCTGPSNRGIKMLVPLESCRVLSNPGIWTSIWAKV
jgi:hypothetical protein